MTGPLAGVRIVELAGIGPGPFACMMLADHGAEVIRVDRPGARVSSRDVLARSRRRIAVDLKSAAGVAVVRDLIASADGLVEGYRPGVMERLGLGPDALIAANPRLVYGRMTGWGQDGPYAQAAGHDINYIALAGALHAFGRAGEKPTPPINLVGDFGGGGMMMAFGMVSAILSARTTGKGQVIDCAMTDGSALLMAMIWSFRAQGHWADDRGVNLLDTGAPFYDTYETADGKFVSIGSLEPQFYALLCEKAGAGRGVHAADGHHRLARPAHSADRSLPPADARRMVRGDGRDRRLLRPRAVDGRGTRASPQRRARDFRRGGRRDPARPRTALFRNPHAAARNAAGRG